MSSSRGPEFYSQWPGGARTVWDLFHGHRGTPLPSLCNTAASYEESPASMAAKPANTTAQTPANEELLRPMQQFAMALALYVLWGFIAWLGALAGELTIDDPGTIVLLSGIATTNALFFGIARSREASALSAEGLAAAQSVLGLVWACVFLVFSVGGNQLALGMSICATLFALFQLPKGTFLHLALVGGAGFAGASALRYGLGRGAWQPELLNLATFLGVTGWLLIVAKYLDVLRQRLQERNVELRQHIEKVVRIAERDHLTKSFNRHAIMDTLSREKGRADRLNTPVSVCILDLDNFKALNDEHGHLIGDRVLKQFSKRARSELRAMDAIQPCDHRRSLGRFGGEEFIAILPSTPLGGAGICAERIRACIADEPFDGLYSVTVSIGVAEYCRGESVHEWLARADESLYKAKADGRNRVVLSGEVQELDAEVRELRPKQG